uniref:Elicitin n=1 Tax=Phytophthora brassicae TaxID=187813 RepID=Q2N0E8_PHYBB|nr:elicitin-like protein BRL5 [Phytophthora brassicae]
MTQTLALALTLAAYYAHQTSAVDVCLISELASLLTNPNTTACASDSGVAFMDLTGPPSDDQMSIICETDTCLSLMAAILAINPDDCILPRNEDLNLMSELVDPVVSKCTAMGVDIAGSSLIGSGSDVTVGDEDNTTSDSGTSGSSDAVRLVQCSSIAVALVVLTIAL